jgi:phosphate transport system ATP-binding protein
VAQNYPHISIKDLNVTSANLHILKNVSIDIPDRSITAIIGPSGCGKTTLLKSMNRLVELTAGIEVAGKVLVNGENIYDPHIEVTRLRKKMGLLSQRPYPLPMSIYSNISFGMRIHGQHKRRILDAKVRRYLALASLWDEVKDRLHEPASSLSIGQQQRLCLARGLAIEPDIILADEPTSALDPMSSKAIEEIFLELKKKYTIVLVTHILRQARRLADYVIFMYAGEIVEHGPADEVLNNPRQELTREYVKGQIS